MPWKTSLLLVPCILALIGTTALAINTSRHIPITNKDTVGPDADFTRSPKAGNQTHSSYPGRTKRKFFQFMHSILPQVRQQPNPKKALGIVSFVFGILSVVTLLAGSGDAFFVFFLAGLLAGIISLAIPRDQKKTTATENPPIGRRKRGNTFAWLGILIPVALVVTAIIVVATADWHF